MVIEIQDNLTVNEYNNLRKSIGWDIKDTSIVENAINNSTIIKKATVDNTTVGIGRVLGDGLYYFIVDIIVASEYQGKGIGRKIIDEIIKEIENRTKENQSCSINLISLNGKEEFYEKCGFTKTPFDYTGCGMIKRIKK